MPGGYDHSFGDPGHPYVCTISGANVFSPADGFGQDDAMECRWLHLEHLLLQCPVMTPPGRLDDLCASVVREHLMHSCTTSPEAVSAVSMAFPVLPDGAPTACTAATACAVPFLLDPVWALRVASLCPAA